MSHEIGVEVVGSGRITYAYIVNNYTVTESSDSITVSGEVILGFNGESTARVRGASVQSVNITVGGVSVLSSTNASVSAHGLMASQKSLGQYTKTISKTHSSQSATISTAVTTLKASMQTSTSVDTVVSNSTSHTEASTITGAPLQSYTVSYNANGGSSTPASQTKWYNEPITLQSAITRTGYNFGGWKWNNSGSPIAAGSSWNGANANGTFYAAWEYKWKKPSFTKLTAWRTGTTPSGGVYPKQDNGTNADVQVVLNAGSQKTSYGSEWTAANTTVKFYYKAHSASSYPTTAFSTQTLSSTSGTLTAHISDSLNTETQYDIKVEAYVTSYSAELAAFTTFISPAFFLVDMTDKGIAFGRAAENDKFLCNLEMSAEGHKLSNAKVNMFDNTRQTSPDVIQDGRTGISHFIGTSTMTSGKPNAQDGHIIHLAWDNTGGWDSQLYLENGNTPKLFMRNQSNGTWGSWVKVYSPNDKPTPADIGAVPTSRKINNNALTSDVTLTASNVGAVPTSDVTTSAEAGKIPKIGDNAVIELPYLVDLHNSTLDYDVRIITTTSGTKGTGTLNITAGSVQWGGQELLKENTPIIKVVKFTVSDISIAAGTMGSQTTHTFTAQSGYTPVGIVGWSTGTGTNMGRVFFAQLQLISATSIQYRLCNTSSAAASGTISYHVLFVKSGNSGGVGY